MNQTPLSMGFPRQEYWSGLPFLSLGDLPVPGIEPASPALAGRFFTTEPPGKPLGVLQWSSNAWMNHAVNGKVNQGWRSSKQGLLQQQGRRRCMWTITRKRSLFWPNTPQIKCHIRLIIWVICFTCLWFRVLTVLIPLCISQQIFSKSRIFSQLLSEQLQREWLKAICVCNWQVRLKLLRKASGAFPLFFFFF